MAKVNFKLKDKKYQLEFLPGDRVEIMALDSKDKFIIPKATKIRDFINYILSLELD